MYKILGNRVSAYRGAVYESKRSSTARKVIETRVLENWKGGEILPVTLKEYLATVSFTTKELKKLYNRISRLERLVKSGELSRARQYGNYLAGSRLLTKAAMHNVLRDRTSPGYGTDLYRFPWFISLDNIRKMRSVSVARKRIWLDKPDGSLRPLAIPTLSDRIRERAIVTVAELLSAKMQSSSSIGFRYNQDRHRGLEEFLSKAVGKYGLMGFDIIDTDFKKYYDSIPHSGLRTIMRKVGLKGGAWRYFCSTLSAPVLSSKAMVTKAQGKVPGPMGERMYIPTKGTPQGGVISPLLANLYGAKLDKGLDALGHVYLRYADNVLVAYPATETKESIIAILNEIKPNGIELHPDKTQSLVGNGTLVTLGCGIIRENGQVRLMVSEGYDRRSFLLGKESQIQRPFGGIPYLGCVLDFLRNLSLHKLHQRSPDRKGWARRVLNLRTYLPKSNPWGLKGGVWREVKISPEFKGIASSGETSWSQVKGWSLKGMQLMDLRSISTDQKRKVKGLQRRLEAVLSRRLAQLAGLRVLQEGFKFSEEYLFYGDLSKVQAKYYRKSARYALELAGHIIVRNHGKELSGREVKILGRGIGKGSVFLKGNTGKKDPKIGRVLIKE
jgi:hypothetical protein